MDICNKQKIDAPRVCTFPFLSSGPCLTKSELGKIRDLESGNLFLGGSREVSRRRWRDDKLETGSTLWAFCSTALGNTSLKYPLRSRRKPTLSRPWADDSNCSEKSCFLSWDTAKWKPSLWPLASYCSGQTKCCILESSSGLYRKGMWFVCSKDRWLSLTLTLISGGKWGLSCVF